VIRDILAYPAYRQSGLSWLPEIPLTWAVRRNGRLFSQRNQTGYPELPILEVSLRTGVRVRDFNGAQRRQMMSDRDKYKRAVKGDIAYNMMRMWQGAVGVAPVDGLVSPAYVVARPSPGTSADYYSHLFRTSAYMGQVDIYSHGIVKDRNRLYWDDFKQISTPYPPPDEQAAIVRFLDHADRRIRRYVRAKQQLIKLLEEEKQVIIHRAVTRGLDPNVRLKPSGMEWLGEVPEHWQVKRLKTISPEITVGVVVNPSSYFTDDGVPFLLGNNVLSGRFRLDTVRYISQESNARLRKSQLRAGDIVVVRVGAPGVAAVIPNDLDRCNCASMMIVRQGREFEPLWLQHLFNSPVIRRQIDIVKYGAAQKQFNISHAVEFLVLLPGIQEQRLILKHLAKELALLDSMISNARREMELTREYRTRLIAEVVTGKLDVRAADASLLDEAAESETIEDAGLWDEGEELGDKDVEAEVGAVEA
jgi:type I restriction enzyme, S subunit